jgi:Flp pilus assembly protein TadD
MRPTLLLLLILLANCSGDQNGSISNRAPGLDVADVALASGAPDTALRIAQQALAANPRNASALVRAAEAQAALGQRDNAAHSFAQARALAPDDVAASLGLARLELATDPGAAVSELLGLTTRDPRNVAALIDLGIARDLLGHHADAQTAYRLALAIDPGRTAAGINLGLSLALSGDLQQALGILRPIALSPGASPRMRQDLAVALVIAGNDEEAAQVLHADMDQRQVLAAVTGYHALRSTP